LLYFRQRSALRRSSNFLFGSDRAERAEDAEAAGVGVESDTADDGTVPADLGPGTTTESTDADAEAPTPGPPTEAHPDGLTPGDESDESGDES
jgi:hypothetical protein